MEQKSINVDFSENGVKLSLVGLDKSEILPKDYSLDDLAEKITKLLNESKNCKITWAFFAILLLGSSQS